MIFFDNIDENRRNGKESDIFLFDELLYQERCAIERTNAWLDAFKAVMARFETKTKHLKSLRSV